MKALFTGVALLSCSVLAGAQTPDPKRLVSEAWSSTISSKGKASP